jgi:hypothetical protein
VADAVLTWLVSNAEHVGVVVLLIVFAALLVSERLVTAGRLASVRTDCDKTLADREARHERELATATARGDREAARAERWEMTSWQLASGISQASAVTAALAQQAGLPAPPSAPP